MQGPPSLTFRWTTTTSPSSWAVTGGRHGLWTLRILVVVACVHGLALGTNSDQPYPFVQPLAQTILLARLLTWRIVSVQYVASSGRVVRDRTTVLSAFLPGPYVA